MREVAALWVRIITAHEADTVISRCASCQLIARRLSRPIHPRCGKPPETGPIVAIP